jgi:hypothetical protein
VINKAGNPEAVDADSATMATCNMSVLVVIPAHRHSIKNIEGYYIQIQYKNKKVSE